MLQGDEPIYERYFDSSPEETSDVRSVTKSVMSLLAGIAIDAGPSEYGPDDGRVEVTLRNGLTRPAGESFSYSALRPPRNRFTPGRPTGRTGPLA